MDGKLSVLRNESIFIPNKFWIKTYEEKSQNQIFENWPKKIVKVVDNVLILHRPHDGVYVHVNTIKQENTNVFRQKVANFSKILSVGYQKYKKI